MNVFLSIGVYICAYTNICMYAQRSVAHLLALRDDTYTCICIYTYMHVYMFMLNVCICKCKYVYT